MAVEINSDLLGSLRYAAEQKRFWTKKYDEIVEMAEKLAGDEEELSFDGKVVYTNRRTAAFQTKQFAKENPDAFAFYLRREMVEVETLDIEALKTSRPDLFAKYQSRSFRPVV